MYHNYFNYKLSNFSTSFPMGNDVAISDSSVLTNNHFV